MGFTLAATTRTSTSPGPGLGSGMSRRVRALGGPYSGRTMARTGHPLLFLAELAVEEGDRPLPRELGRGGVVARGRVVVEAVLRARIDERLVVDVRRLQRLLVGRPRGVDALVVLGEVQQQRRLD